MKILFFNDNFFDLIGGREAQVKLLAKHISNKHQVGFACLNFRQECMAMASSGNYAIYKYIRHDDFIHDKIFVHSLVSQKLFKLFLAVFFADDFLSNNYPNIYYSKLRIIFYIRRLLCKLGQYNLLVYYFIILNRIIKNYDIVHTHTISNITSAIILSCKWNKKPIVITPYVHPGSHGENNNDLRNYNNCQAVVALLEGDKKHLISLGVNQSKIRVTGVSPENLNNYLDQTYSFRDKYNLSNQPIVIFIARMEEYKGWRVLLKSTKLVWEKFPETRFIFIGPGESDKLKIINNFDPRVFYLGAVDERTKANALNSSNIFCLPSSSEIFPVGISEAWYLGKPVIVGPAPGLGELVEMVNGGLKVEQEENQVGHAIIKLLSDKNLSEEMGSSGRKFISENFSVEKLVEKQISIYNNLLINKMD